jgi:hypothetical protein
LKSDFLRASEYLAQAIELANDENPELVAIQRMNLAFCYMKSGLPKKAIEQMEVAVSEAGPEFLDAFRAVKQDKVGEEVIEQVRPRHEGNLFIFEIETFYLELYPLVSPTLS